GFEEFSQELLNRLNDTDSDINYVKDMLSSDKNLLLEELDALRADVDNISNDDRLNDLLESKLSLEDSFNSIREELTKFEELEGSLNELRENLLGLESYNDKFDNLHSEINRLSNSIDDLTSNNENIISNLDTISSNFEVLNNNFEDVNRNVSDFDSRLSSFKEDIDNAINKSLELENSISVYRKDLEDKLGGITNNINSLNNDSTIKDLFSEE
ncbi:hypothetical protein R4I97_12020, partial [Brachyspira pilosicoli]|uniref:hypothetical protein n=1 Tax=Brachyspira pilosicoli TaxID=52584 RepID=UPI003007CD61